MRHVDLIVIGAGPAGMAAAVQAAGAGVSVAVLDEQPQAGGQIYRAVTGAGATRGAILGKDYLGGGDLVRALAMADVWHLPGAVVWDIAQDHDGFVVTYTRNGRAVRMNGTKLVLATGALERPVPVPGWTLVGVMTAGAGQILLKSSGLVPQGAVLAGSGPLLYLLAAQMVRAGVPPQALVETQGLRDMLRAAPHLGHAWRGWRTLAKGIGLLAELRRAGVRRFTDAQDLRIAGTDRAEGLSFVRRGRSHHIECDTVLLHQGVVPNTQITRALRLDHVWLDGQKAFAPRCDRWGETTLPGLFCAGDGAGIEGAIAAADAGRLAALQIVYQLGRTDEATRDLMARRIAARRASEAALRPFLETAYPPSAQILDPADDTVICRCEEVTAGALRGWARAGCTGPNQIKAFGRVGMGPCQGRFCAQTVTQILSRMQGRHPRDIGQFRTRPPYKPVTLGELAALDESIRPE